ncbi:hypothetical protein PLICRDRAFT_40186 [Plicaturopsis crispa FD-325 SS-3]|nr:hypothetical protein PLICRDRAFT_40186 [Plicaturopsis crispa FD-325 SS-3]
MHDNDPQTLDAEKAKNLSSQQHGTSTPHPEGAPGWNEHLASASEAAVKADRHAKPAADMQRETIDYIHARHSDDKPSQRGTDASDEVGGPLGAGGGAKETSGGGAKEVIKKKTSVHEETTEVDVDVQTATDSEHFVKADRGEV